jgi:antitoxin VapB
MALRINDWETERLATEVATMTGESKTTAIRRSLEERRDRLSHEARMRDRKKELYRLLEQKIWPRIPPFVLGTKVSRREKARILGYGPERS